MSLYKTKFFGELAIDETSDYEYLDLLYNNMPLYISLTGFNGQEEKTAKCIEIIDQYDKIHDISQKTIIEEFETNEVIQYYFKNHFDTLEKEITKNLFGTDDFSGFSAEETVKKLDYPDLVFSLEYNEISLSVDYRVSKEYSDEVLSIKMDENLTIFDFSREN